MKIFSELLLFLKALFNPFDFAEYLKDLKRKQQELYCYQQSLNGLKQAYKYGKIPEHIYKYVGIGNNIWGTARYGYNPKKTAKRRAKNKLKNR